MADLIVGPGELATIARDCARATRLAVDLEASGMHAYRARACTVQLSWNGGQRVAVVDALATSIEGLGELMGANGPVKIVHDVAFDARLLADAGIALAHVHDTAIAARMLGRASTGLASLLESELGLHISKALQHHDWRIRPLTGEMLGYLALDVGHLEALERKLWNEVIAKGIEAAVLEETRYRIEGARESAAAPIPPPSSAYLRVKGTDRLTERELAVLRALAEAREHEAEARDVPPHKVASAEALIALARSRPTTIAEVGRVRGMGLVSADAIAFAEKIVRGVAHAGDTLPESEHAHWHPLPLPSAVIKTRRERESRLLAWRRGEAQRREVDEQVVLPGHCLKYAAAAGIDAIEALARVPGIGAFRIERDGQDIVNALRGEAPASDWDGIDG